MDEASVNYSESRFNEIKAILTTNLKKYGYNPAKTEFIPISGWIGDNLVERSAKMPWCTGPILIEALDRIAPVKRLMDRPLRIPVLDVYKIGGVGTVVVGRVESGVLKPGMEITVCPSGLLARTKTIEMHYESIEEAVPGDNIGFNVNKNLIRRNI